MKWIAPHGAATSTERYRNAQPTIAGSNPDAAFFNTVLDELLAVIVAADMTPTDANLHQIADAIEYLTERAATSGVTKGSYWFGKTTANFTVPNPTLAEQNYIDFTTLKTYSAKSDLSGWTQTGTFVPPVGIDFTILITSKFWDIPEQDDQQGGWAQYNHTDDEWSWWPRIINLDNVVHLTGNETISGNKTFSGTVKAPTISSTTDNSTKVATTAFVSKVLGAIYPVGSLYFGTQSTCPMATLISGSTWTVVATKIVVATGNSIPVVGNGISIGYTDGQNNGALGQGGNNVGTGIGTKGDINAYGQPVGTSMSAENWGRSTTIGLTTDATKSGIIADVSNNTITVNVWKRTA